MTSTNYLDIVMHPFIFTFINLILLLFHQPSVSAQPTATTTYQNISLDSSLTTTGNNTAWLSPSGDFAFGFVPLPTNTSLFLLAIWFAKTNNRTIVWYANGDSPVPNGSRVKLVTYGVLILSDNNGNSIWTANANGSVSYAALLNTGNLILADRDNTITWQSFDHPQDTLLPTQTLPLNNQLRSHLKDDDFSAGRFVLQMQGDGDAVMFPLALPTDSPYESYWVSSTAGVGNQLIFNSSSGDLYLEFTNKTLMKITSSSGVSTTEFYQRVTLDPDGVLRHYIHPKNKTKRSSKSWSDGWTVADFKPSDICMSLSSRIGSGACGFNSYCVVDKNHRRSCVCPPSYSFVNPDNPFLGCKPDFALPSCSQLANTGEQEGMFEMRMVANTDWVYGDYENYQSFNEDQCRDNCLKDCFCVAALYSGLGNGCFKKRFPLSNGRSGTDIMGTTLFKVAKTNFTATSPPPPPPPIDQPPHFGLDDHHTKYRHYKVWVVVGSLSLSLSLLVLFTSFVNCITRRRKRSKRRTFGHGNNSSISESDTLRCFTFKELEEATSGFAKELGRGSSGIVYEGVVLQSRVAVKKLDKNFREIEKEFIAELQSIGRTHHKNLVRLFGYCNEGSNRLLVYEFMSNGSLTSFLFGQGVKPAWNKRVEIAMGIARGILYLHEECSSSIIHCDIKPQNMLLDNDLNVRISDFGLAKLLRSDQTGTLTGIRGTKGYIAPEWFNNMPITNKVDVYSFGVILLEIICCRRNVEFEKDCEEKEVLVYWAYDCYRNEKVELLIGNDDYDDDEAMADMELFKKLLMLAIWCVQEDPSKRPTMRTVNQVLDGVVVVPTPPNPANDFFKSFS